MVKRVRFRNYDIQYEIENGNYKKVVDRRKRVKVNRRLSRMERYLRKNGLLMKNQFLEYSNFKRKSLELIEYICLERGWISKKQHLHIIQF